MFDFMDRQVREAVDLDYILEKIRPVTPYGTEYKKSMKPYPLGTEAYLRQDLDWLEKFLTWGQEDRPALIAVKRLLRAIKDVRYSLTRAKGGAILSEVELYEIKNIVFTVKELIGQVEQSGLLASHKTKLAPMPELEESLNPQGENPRSFYLYDAYSERLADLRRRRSDLENESRRELRRVRKQLKEGYNLSLNADSTVVLSKQDRQSIERAESCPYLVFQSETFNSIVFSMKQTDEFLSMKEEIDYYKLKENQEEQKILAKLSQEVGRNYSQLRKNINGIANIDLYIAKAEMTETIKGVKPQILDDHQIKIQNGRYPKIEDKLNKEGMNFTPISIEVSRGVTCITGANMGGKTISLKLVGLLCIMAQMGMFVPAQEMELGLNSFVRTSIGDFQSTSSGLSTFGGEIENVTYAMKYADQRGLLLIDELARGTNPQEGYAISLAIVHYLQGKEAITILTTHFDQVTRHPGIRHLQVVGLANVELDQFNQDKEGSALQKINQLMDYRLQEVSQFIEVPKDAIRIAHMMGLPEEITRYAEDTLKNGW